VEPNTVTEVKLCKECLTVKPVTEFYPRYTKGKYNMRPRPQCIACENGIRIAKRAAEGKKTSPYKSHPHSRRVYKENKPMLNVMALWPPATHYVRRIGTGQPIARVRANPDKQW
jgi:hypothetical protein